jgi:lipopolysaccharide transport system permease protein
MIQEVRTIWAHRHFWLSLVKLDLRNRYRRSFLGVGWSLLHPIAMTAVFCVVFSSLGMSGSQRWQDYAPFVLTGMCIWDFIRNSITGGSFSLIQNESYIRQVPLPYSIYPLRTVLGNVLHFMIGLAVVLVLIVLVRGNFDVFAHAWSLIPSVLLLIAFAWGLATIVAYLTVFFRDIKHVVEVAMQVAFFLTPIIYSRKTLDDKGLGFIVDLNPANTFIEMIRAPLINQAPPSMSLFIFGFCAAAVSVFLAAGTTHWLKNRVIFHL